MPKYYLLDENKNLVEGFDKEGFLALLEQAIEDGSLENIDENSAVASKIKSIVNGTTHNIEFVTEAQYNQLEAQGLIVANTYYFITDDTSFEGLENAINTLTSRITSVETDITDIKSGATSVGTTTAERAANADLKRIVYFCDSNYNGANLLNPLDISYVSGEVVPYKAIAYLKNYTFVANVHYIISVRTNSTAQMYLNENKFVGVESLYIPTTIVNGFRSIIITPTTNVTFGSTEEVLIKCAEASTFNLSDLVVRSQIDTPFPTKAKMVYDPDFNYNPANKTLRVKNIDANTSFTNNGFTKVKMTSASLTLPLQEGKNYLMRVAIKHNLALGYSVNTYELGMVSVATYTEVQGSSLVAFQSLGRLPIAIPSDMIPVSYRFDYFDFDLAIPFNIDDPSNPFIQSYSFEIKANSTIPASFFTDNEVYVYYKEII